MKNLNHNPDHDFQVGEIVRLIRKTGGTNREANEKQFGWFGVWSEIHTAMLGRMVIIAQVGQPFRHMIVTEFPKNDGYYCIVPSSALERI